MTQILWSAHYYTICVLLSLQGVVIVLYNINYWSELFRKDSEYKANYFILVGDTIFLFAAVLLWVKFNFLFKHFVQFLIGGYCAIFCGEVFSQYIQSLRLLYRDLVSYITSIRI